MRIHLVSALLLAIAFMPGCKGTAVNVRTVNLVDPAVAMRYEFDNHGGMTPEARQILQARLAQRLGSRLAADAPTVLTVKVTYYRMRHGAARALAGVMAGQDRIVSEITIRDETGKLLGSLHVDSKNPTALFTARGLIEEHADKIADYALSTSTPRAQRRVVPDAAPALASAGALP